MAMNLDITTVYGIAIQAATLRVEQLHMPNPQFMSFAVRAYADTSRPFVSESWHSCAFDESGASPHAQAYAYLKSLPEFANAVDC